MCNLEQLIEKASHSGTVFKMLKEVASYSSSRVSSAGLNAATFVGVDNLLPNFAGKVEASYSPNTAQLTAYEPGDVLLGNIRPYLKKLWLADSSGGCSGDVLAIRILPQAAGTILPEFLYRVLATDAFISHNMRHAKGAKMPRGSKEAIMRYPIPLPPVDIQREIVRVLANFHRAESELESEIEAELVFRRSQVAICRRSLLVSNTGHCATGKLREVAHFRNAKAHEKLVDPNGEVALLTSRFVSTQGRMARYVRKEHVLTPAFRGETALVMSDLPKGRALAKAFYVDHDDRYAANQRVGLLKPKDPQHLDSRFLYYMVDRNPQLLAYDNGLDQTHLKKDWILDIVVPIPDIEVQRKIVSTLDSLIAVGEDLEQELVKELGLRQKQYEHYRERLLTFQEAT